VIDQWFRLTLHLKFLFRYSDQQRNAFEVVSWIAPVWSGIRKLLIPDLYFRVRRHSGLTDP